MIFSRAKTAAPPTIDPLGREGGRNGKILLYTLSYLSMAVSIAAVVWANGQSTLLGALLFATALGHIVSALGRQRYLRLSFLTYPLAGLAIWSMRVDLLAIFAGGSFAPLALLLAVMQALVSFNIRSLRTAYDALLLSLATILLASEGALSTDFVVFLLTFGVVAVGFLATAHLLSEARSLRWAPIVGPFPLSVPLIAIVVLIFVVALGVFLALPQSYRVQTAASLPSRVDLTVGQPIAPRDLPPGDAAPWSQFLPSRDLDPADTASPVEPVQSGSPVGSATSGGIGSGPVTEHATLGYVGEDDFDVVMYVRSPLASYWRGQTLDHYDGRGWVASSGNHQVGVDSEGLLRFTDMPAWTGRTSTYVQTFFLKVPQRDSVFTGYSPGVIRLTDESDAADVLQRAVDNVETLQEVGSYRVVSASPRITPDLLQNDFTTFGYLTTVDTIAIPQRVQDLAVSITAGARTDFEKAARLEQFLLNNFAYDLRVGPLSRSKDVVEAFLFERQAGYCSQFATAMAVMARAIGLPARVATGYLPGTFDSMTGVHVVRLSDAHAWVEIKFRRAGWVPFDPTPRPDSPWALDIGATQATQTFQGIIRSYIKDLTLDGPSAALGGINAFLGADALGRAGTGTAAIALPVLAAGMFLRKRGSRRRSRKTDFRGYTTLPGNSRNDIRRHWRKTVALLEKKGYPKPDVGHSPQGYVHLLEEMKLPIPDALRRVTQGATQALYDPRPLNKSTLTEVHASLKQLRRLPKLQSANTDG